MEVPSILPFKIDNQSFRVAPNCHGLIRALVLLTTRAEPGVVLVQSLAVKFKFENLHLLESKSKATRINYKMLKIRC